MPKLLAAKVQRPHVSNTISVDKLPGLHMTSKKMMKRFVGGDCEKEMKKLENEATMESAEKCEQSNGYDKEVFNDLVNGASEAADDAAIKELEKMYEDCAKLSPSCAAMVADEMDMEMRMQGVAVSDECMQAAQNAQGGDEKSQNAMAACQEKDIEKIVQALDSENLDKAEELANASLQHCMHLNNQCAWQCEDVLLGEILDALQGQPQQVEIARKKPHMRNNVLEKTMPKLLKATV